MEEFAEHIHRLEITSLIVFTIICVFVDITTIDSCTKSFNSRATHREAVNEAALQPNMKYGLKIMMTAITTRVLDVRFTPIRNRKWFAPCERPKF